MKQTWRLQGTLSCLSLWSGLCTKSATYHHSSDRLVLDRILCLFVSCTSFNLCWQSCSSAARSFTVKSVWASVECSIWIAPDWQVAFSLSGSCSSLHTCLLFAASQQAMLTAFFFWGEEVNSNRDGTYVRMQEAQDLSSSFLNIDSEKEDFEKGSVNLSIVYTYMQSQQKHTYMYVCMCSTSNKMLAAYSCMVHQSSPFLWLPAITTTFLCWKGFCWRKSILPILVCMYHDLCTQV